MHNKVNTASPSFFFLAQIRFATNAFFSLSLSMQAQYVFVHDSLSELVMCGETEVGATNFRIKMNQLQKPIPGDPSGATGFQRQFEVHYMSCTVDFICMCNMFTHLTHVFCECQL